MASIADVIIKTLISVESEVSSLCGRYFRNRYLARRLRWHPPCYPYAMTVVVVPNAARCRARRSGPAAARSACFEVFGFDVLLDQDLRAWVIEVRPAVTDIVPALCCCGGDTSSTLHHTAAAHMIDSLPRQVNVSPSLSSSSPLDKRIKNMLMTDTFHLAGFTAYDPRKLDEEIEKRKQERLLGKSKAPGASSCSRPLSQPQPQSPSPSLSLGCFRLSVAGVFVLGPEGLSVSRSACDSRFHCKVSRHGPVVGSRVSLPTRRACSVNSECASAGCGVAERPVSR
jgi:hypothetical protein